MHENWRGLVQHSIDSLEAALEADSEFEARQRISEAESTCGNAL